jgi:peroxiredoxin Q/BCP
MSKVSRSIVGFIFLVTALGAAAALPEVGKPAPDFRLRNQHGTGVTLQDFRGKWVVLSFYVVDFSRPDTLQWKNFQRDAEKYTAANAIVVGVASDGPESHLTFAHVNKITFPLLSDPGSDVATLYGSATPSRNPQTSDRHTFLIDPKGNVVKVFTKASPARHSDEVLKALTELQAAK